jgi:hypothetical protein
MGSVAGRTQGWGGGDARSENRPKETGCERIKKETGGPRSGHHVQDTEASVARRSRHPGERSQWKLTTNCMTWRNTFKTPLLVAQPALISMRAISVEEHSWWSASGSTRSQVDVRSLANQEGWFLFALIVLAILGRSQTGVLGTGASGRMRWRIDSVARARKKTRPGNLGGRRGHRDHPGVLHVMHTCQRSDHDLPLPSAADV